MASAAGIGPAFAVSLRLATMSTKVSSETENFKSADTGLTTLFNNSAGFAVFPSIGKGGLVFGGEHGKGLVYQSASPVGEATLTEINVGPRLAAGPSTK